MEKPVVRQGLGALVLGLGWLAALSACERPELAITSGSEIEGTVNASPVAVEVAAVLEIGSGGSTTCTFSALPEGFNPGTLGTHA